jgi:hypothetical protein
MDELEFEFGEMSFANPSDNANTATETQNST